MSADRMIDRSNGNKMKSIVFILNWGKQEDYVDNLFVNKFRFKNTMR